MKMNLGQTEAGKRYATAYSTHYKDKDLLGALKLYRQIIASFPEDQEAGFSRAQIGNIVKSVVPEQKLLDAQVDLALALLES